MAPIRFILALSSLAIFAAIFGASPVNALAVDSHHVQRHVHDSIAKEKRGQPSRCKPRPSSTSLSTASSLTHSSSSSAWTPPPSSSSWKASSSSVAHPASSSSPPSSGSSSSGGIGKLGIAWANGADTRLNLLKNQRSKFLYTWSPDIPELALTLGFTPVPQLWGWNQVSDFQSKVKAGYANYVLGMNEPNQVGQSDMSAQSGAQLWSQYIQPLKNEGYQLGSPATTSAPDGMTWMQDFFSACHGCTVDFMAVHFYDDTFAKLQAYLELWHNTFQLPIWVTEFACQNFNGGPQPSSAEIWAFYTQAIAYMDSMPWVHVYFPFGFMEQLSNVNPADGLFSGNSLSALGWLLLNGH